MRDQITPERVANSIRLQRQEFKGTFLLVEGRTDKCFYERFINGQTCRVSTHFRQDNKNNTIKTVKILDKDKFSGILAIVDADFWVLEKVDLASQNVLLTDAHGLETMLFQSPAFDKFLAEFCSEDKLKTMIEQRKDVRGILLEIARPIGYLRWYSIRNNLHLKFEGLRFKKFVNIKNLAFSQIDLIKAIKNNSNRPELDEEKLEADLDELQNEAHDIWHICCGHDLVSVLSIGLRSVFGTYEAKQVESNFIGCILRVSYEHSYFQKTNLYRDIQNWEKINHPFKVLEQSPS